MIYAEIKYNDNQKDQVYLEFFGDSGVFLDKYNSDLTSLYNSSKELYFNGKYLKSRSFLLNFLAREKFIPAGENLFYKN